MHEFDLNDLMKQLKTLRRMTRMQEFLSFVPGLGHAIPEVSWDSLDVRKIGRYEAILRSMTPTERRNADLLDVSRRVRVAKGSGTSLMEVGDLVSDYYRMRRVLRGER